MWTRVPVPQFRYLVDGQEWINDSQADAYIYNPYGTSNCLLITDLAFNPYRDGTGAG